MRYANLAASVSLCIASAGSCFAQGIAGNRSDSVHTTRLIAVEREVKLEVLDWGGTGHPLILLAGLGNTGHVFDELAPRLRASYHVVAITRRGFGRSSAPSVGYAADRLADDVLAVADSLHLDRPAVVGHSIAGEELSSIGARHPDRVSGLIYLDAAYAYAFYDSTRGDFTTDLAELRRNLAALQSAGDNMRAVDALLQRDLPMFQRDLRDMKDEMRKPTLGEPAFEQPSPDDRRSFAALHTWLQRTGGFSVPVAELREQYLEATDGSVGRRSRPIAEDQRVSQAILDGEKRYFTVGAPVLAIFANPKNLGRFTTVAAKAAMESDDSSQVAQQIAAVRRAVPNAKIVRIRGANHYLFLTNENEVVKEMNTFLKELWKR